MAVLDLFQGIAAVVTGLVHEHNVDKYAKLILTMAVAGFCGYYAARGSTAPMVFKAGLPVAAADFLGRCAGYAAMAVIVWRTWKANLPKGTTAVTPPGIDEAEKK